MSIFYERVICVIQVVVKIVNVTSLCTNAQGSNKHGLRQYIQDSFGRSYF